MLGAICLLVPSLVLSSLLYAGKANADVVGDLLGNQLVCTLAERERASMRVAPLYQVSDGQCVAVVPDGDSGSWFSDDQCVNPVVYTRTNMQNYCLAASDRSTLGNGVGIRADSWSLTPGNQLDFGSRSLDGVTQPYVQRLVYRRVQTSRGSCDLEMRVYKSHPSATGQRSMIALHGGSWTSRSFGYLGLELTVPHFVDQGFVVYAPFYRLLDNTDSSAACNQADFNDIVNDADFALDWVLSNAPRFGSSGAPVAFGQSAGGHLALSLAVNHPASISGAVLMYPPTDFTDFLQRVQSGAYSNPEGLSILNRVVGQSADQADLSLPLVGENSFPMRIASEGSQWPAMFIVQGSADDLVEARQAVRLCDALAGKILPEVDQEVGIANELRDIIECSSQSTPSSQLHLIKQGKHALDVCINATVPDLCQSGDAASRSLVSQSISDAMAFSVAAHQSVIDRVNASSTGPVPNTDSGSADMATQVSTGGGGAVIVFLLLLPWVLFRRLNRRHVCRYDTRGLLLFR